MNALKVVALALIVAGALALAYGGFTYTKKTHKTEIGPISFAVQEKETVNVPIWAGIASIVAGGVLLFVQTKK
jgi:TRAP-type C4-dicarboxylate transport system permease small subunit